ncbi:MAG: hypothetical protein ACJA1E_000888 [Paracoccaceae bacterium]|jgi:hypothetical protein
MERIMSQIFKKLAIAATLSASMALPAFSATVPFSSVVTTQTGGGTNSVTTATPGRNLEVDFSQTGGRKTQVVTFTAGVSFDLFIDSYTDGTSATYSAWTLQRTSGTPEFYDVAGAYSQYCKFAQVPVSSDNNGFCNAITTTGGPGQSSTGVSATPIFEGLPSGDYIIGFYQPFGSESTSTTASFNFLGANVPLPASGFVLLGALGMFGAVAARKRKKA